MKTSVVEARDKHHLVAQASLKMTILSSVVDHYFEQPSWVKMYLRALKIP